MKRIIGGCVMVVSIATLVLMEPGCNSDNTLTADGNIITFYEVPLVCGAAPDIGCGSRIKPFFLDTEKQRQIKESWSNREGTLIAIVWSPEITSESDREDIIQPLFEKNAIEAKLISEETEIADYVTSMKEDKWYKGMDIDQLSLEEAGVIAEDLTSFAFDKGLITQQEKDSIKIDLEAYFKKELVIVRTCDELESQETREKWRQDGRQIYVKYIGEVRADSVAAYYDEFQQMQEEKCKKEGKESCCDEEEKCSKK